MFFFSFGQTTLYDTIIVVVAPCTHTLDPNRGSSSLSETVWSIVRRTDNVTTMCRSMTNDRSVKATSRRADNTVRKRETARGAVDNERRYYSYRLRGSPTAGRGSTRPVIRRSNNVTYQISIGFERARAGGLVPNVDEISASSWITCRTEIRVGDVNGPRVERSDSRQWRPFRSVRGEIPRPAA